MTLRIAIFLFLIKFDFEECLHSIILQIHWLITETSSCKKFYNKKFGLLLYLLLKILVYTKK